MQVVQSVSGKFHHFHLARQLHQRQMLAAIFSLYPRLKLQGEQLPPELIHTFPYLHLVFLAALRLGVTRPEVMQPLALWDHVIFDTHVARFLPECDVFVGLSNSGLKTGRVAQSRGARYICDRGSSHIRFQDRILQEEFRRWGHTFQGVDPQVIAREEAEYAAADAISVPSHYVRRTFIEMGIPGDKVAVVPYGCDVSRFAKVGSPSSESFDVLFVGQVSFRKGVPYLLEAFANLRHPRKTLTIVGGVHPAFQQFLMGKSLENVTFTGIQPHAQLKGLMSRSHVMVLPSIEEGLALVQGEALACGCPVIATENAGAEDLFDNEIEGFIVPARDAAAITDRLERLAQDPALRDSMSERALQRVNHLGGWDTYGSRYVEFLESVCE